MEVDCLTLLPATTTYCLDDGFVRLVDVMPRLVPQGRTIESAIVRSARVSFGQGLKTPEEDARLVRYLIKNSHTSPLESVKFSFHIRCPLFVAVHLIRHRTANVNMFSQRYAESDDSYMHPSQIEKGIRAPSKTNKQAGDTEITNGEVIRLIEDTEALLDQIFVNYHKLLEAGVAKEVARFCLPQATYTELYYTMDLNNLLKFLRLRDDTHTQHETRVFAHAMKELIRPLLPVVFAETEIEENPF